MIRRNLKLIETRDATYAEFTTFNIYMEKPKIVKRLLTQKEIQKVKELLARNDDYAIDNFCYSIV